MGGKSWPGMQLVTRGRGSKHVQVCISTCTLCVSIALLYNMAFGHAVSIFSNFVF